MGPSSSPGLVVDPAQFVGQKRRGQRRPVGAEAMLRPDAGPPTAKGRLVWVLNLSLAGVGLRSQDELAVGSMHRIRLETTTLRLTSRLRVVRCAPAEGDFEVGAVFIED